MRVIKNASINGFLSAQSGCAFETIGMIVILFTHSMCSYSETSNSLRIADHLCTADKSHAPDCSSYRNGIIIWSLQELYRILSSPDNEHRACP